jgi:hypothetical protein
MNTTYILLDEKSSLSDPVVSNFKINALLNLLVVCFFLVTDKILECQGERLRTMKPQSNRKKIQP